MPAQVRIRNDLHYTVFGALRCVCLTLNGFKGAVNRWLLHELIFLQFSVSHVLVGLRKKGIKNFAFLSWVCAAGFNNNNNTYKTWRHYKGER